MGSTVVTPVFPNSFEFPEAIGATAGGGARPENATNRPVVISAAQASAGAPGRAPASPPRRASSGMSPRALMRVVPTTTQFVDANTPVPGYDVSVSSPL